MIQTSGFFSPLSAEPQASDDRLEALYETEDGHCAILRGHRNDRIVVYKVLKAQYRNDPVWQRMLRREYEIGASLKHPGICEILGWREIPGFGEGIEMEWIDGISLDEWAASHHGDVSQTRKILLDLCDALAYLHRKQVIHRDLKPSNIMVTSDGSYVKIIDFGLADSNSILSGKGPAGTYDFAAPEVAMGGQADVSSDIYSLGRIIQDMGPSFSKVAKKCLRADKTRRFASAEKVREALLEMRRKRLAAILVPVLIVLAATAVYLSFRAGSETVEDIFMNSVQMARDASTLS